MTRPPFVATRAAHCFARWLAGVLLFVSTLAAARAASSDTHVDPGVEPAHQVGFEELPPLPDPHGYGGPFVGTLSGPEGEVLVVAGGANFPDGPPWEGGAKVWHASTWLFDGTAWRAGTPLPKPRAYGATVNVDGELWLIGGGDADDSTAETWVGSLTADGDIAWSAGPPLPEPSQFLSATVVGEQLVVLGAQRSADPLDCVRATWVMDLAERGKGWRSSTPFPGDARVKLTTAAQKDARGIPCLYAFSGEVPGEEHVAFAGGKRVQFMSDEIWAFEPVSGTWARAGCTRSVPFYENAPPAPATPESRSFDSCSAAVAWPVGPAHIVVFSGVGGVPLEVPAAERAEFPPTLHIYHTVTGAFEYWADEPMLRGVVTTGIAPWKDGFVIASGEVRPGVRTNQVQFGRVLPAAPSLAPIDFGVMAMYLAALMALGAVLSRRVKSAEAFFLADRRIPWWAAGLSIYATQLSAITYMAIPAKAFVDDWVFAVTSLSILVMAPIVIVFYLPFFRRLGISTAYEYLERRFSLGVRLFGSASFIGFQVARMAVVVFLPSLALSTVTGVPVHACILVTGLLATAYTVLGGFEAVVWTDVLQVAVLIAGLFVALFLAIDGAGGLGAAMEVAESADKLRWYAPGGSWTETASWSVLVGALFLQLGPYTTDQTVVQRYLSTKDERGAARSVLLNGVMAVPLTWCFFAMGSALFAYFTKDVGKLPLGMGNDEVFPLFVALELPAGLAGLVLAGILAASMSSLDSSMHAIATAWTNDWYLRLGLGKGDAWAVGRRVTLLMGIVGTAAASLIAACELRSMYDAFQVVLGLLVSPLAGIFILGIFTRRATATGAAVGALAAIAVLAWVQNATPLNFMLYGAVGTLTTVFVGYGASFLSTQGRDLAGLTWRTRVAAVQAPDSVAE